MISLKNSISLRLLRYVFGCYLVVTIVVTGVQLVSEYDHVRTDTFDQLNDLQRTFNDSFAASLWSFDNVQLEATLLGMRKIDTVSGIKIENEKSETLAFVGLVPSQENKKLTSEKLDYPGITKVKLQQKDNAATETLFEYRFPILHKENDVVSDSFLGYGYIYASESVIIDQVKYSFLLIIINSIIKTLALWLFFLIFADRLVARPMNELANAAKALNPEKPETLLSSKGLERILNAKHKDELYLLASNFDQMRQAMLERINIIESQNQTLETRVQERTQSLIKANSELKHLALHDTLTGLPNRSLFQDRLEHTLKAAKRSNTRFAVASIDLKNFKTINDTFGHPAGDQLLKDVARRMSSVLRSSDTLARIGGDEFSAIFPVENENQTIVVDHLIGALSRPFKIENSDMNGFQVLANIGTAIFPEHGKDAGTLLKNADMAMYRAKRSGMRYASYSSDEDSKLRRRSKISNDLKGAIENDQLRLLYQPILDINAGNIAKLEALVRWEHPELGLLSPVEFIPISEQNGTIQVLTQWVLSKVCQQNKDLFKSGESISVSVNLSGSIIDHPDLPALLESICIKSDVSPSNIVLEVTETAAMNNPEHVVVIMDELNSRGFRISIDDFGTGYSSFAYLTRLPVKELKIDKSFLLNLNPNSPKVIKAMIDVAHSLKLNVVAEGVENEALLNMLDDMGCDFAQGYHIAKPLSIEDFNQWQYAEPQRKTM